MYNINRIKIKNNERAKKWYKDNKEKVKAMHDAKRKVLNEYARKRHEEKKQIINEKRRKAYRDKRIMLLNQKSY